jgi:putative addiction module component (TIGR02574 family)
MASTKETLRDAALRLPEADRAWIAEELLESLPPVSDGLTDEEWEAELDRRVEDYKKHPEKAIPWDEVKKML